MCDKRLVKALADLGIPSRNKVIHCCREVRANGEKIVFTHGAFDLLHIGHVVYLEAASKLGDVLVVGIHADEPISAFKGEGRPVFPLVQRAKIVTSLETVDYVVVCWHQTAEEVVSALQPDIYVKDSGYNIMAMPESRVVQAYGGELRTLPYTEGISTTEIINRLMSVFCGR
jgi:rfaE bifunctional protein nucleotidyltransferase chain/domain